MKHLIIIFSLFLFAQLSGTTLQAQDNYPFLPHENLELLVYYNLGPFWVHAGDVDLKADTITYEGKKCVQFVATGRSLKKWNFIFSLKDHYRSIVELNGFKPLYYEKNTMEDGFWIHNIYRFNWNKKRLNVFTESIRDPAKDTTYHLTKTLFDVLSATYYLRTLDPKKLHPGDTIPIPLITDGKFVTYYIVYSGPGILKRKKKRIACSVYHAIITSSTFFSKKDPLLVYVTDNKKQIIIFAEANIIVGSIKAYQKHYQNLRPGNMKGQR